MRFQFSILTMLVGTAALAATTACHSIIDRPKASPPQNAASERPYMVTGRLTEDDLQQLERLVGELTKDKVLKIEVTKPDHVEVMTGIVRGPLDGGGSIFEFERKNGSWVQINKDNHRGWVS